MVYRGKPSGACAECRKRRTRCDRKVPSCGPCTRGNRVCHGYRDLLDLAFCDETSNVTKKARVVPLTPQEQPPTSLPIHMRDVVIYQTIDDLGINFFMKNYVGAQAILSQFDFLPSFYVRDGRSCPYFKDSIKAVGLAGYAKATRRVDLLRTTTKTYISAIREVNKALSDPNSAGRDTTLIAVLLLAMYEVLILPGRKGLRNLTKHLHGAVSVAAFGQSCNEKTAIGEKLLICLCQVVTFNSWMQDIPLPPRFMNLRRHIDQAPGRHYNIHWHFLGVLADLIEFRTALRTGQYASASAIISRAMDLDHSIKIFAGALAPTMAFEEVFTATDHVLTLGGYYHVYSHIASAHLLNNIRAARIRLHCVIVKQCDILLSKPEFGSKSIQRTASAMFVRKVAREICATVPQMSGYHLHLETQSSDTIRMTTQDLATSHLSPSPGSSSDSPATPFLPNLTLISNALDASSAPTNTTNKPPGTKIPAKISLRHYVPLGPLPLPAHYLTETPDSSRPLLAQPQPQPSSNIPTQTQTQSSLYPTLPVPQGQSLYSTLYHLHMLDEIEGGVLERGMRRWVKGRIAWIRWKAEVEKLELLGALLGIRSVWC
ncbi:hypothetical protein P154DRAFT_624337 [Amniculicola lignicola CBS 123094]|uniref:Zn(2)-C6 fungal-type domain-containing protein n=1 Tax=Amniculicola lignicola CBS 123094 TaxID=1392246 RepID=A0A6A5WBA8_9PLEO|nr:hypothetical protein P154DRAFT_624337 [Amniculicola lignicola CBS 123094]